MPPKFNMPPKKVETRDVTNYEGQDEKPSKPFKYEVVGPEPTPEPERMYPPMEAPEGMKWVFNRLQEEYSTPFDSKPQKFGPNQFRLFTPEVAMFIANTSIFQFSKGKAIKALVMEPKKGFGVPFPKDVTAHAPEMIDRYGDPNPIGRGTGGVPTTPKIVRV